MIRVDSPGATTRVEPPSIWPLGGVTVALPVPEFRNPKNQSDPTEPGEGRLTVPDPPVQITTTARSPSVMVTGEFEVLRETILWFRVEEIAFNPAPARAAALGEPTVAPNWVVLQVPASEV